MKVEVGVVEKKIVKMPFSRTPSHISSHTIQIPTHLHSSLPTHSLTHGANAMTFQDVVEHHTLQHLPRNAPRRDVEPGRDSYQNAMCDQMVRVALISVAAIAMVVTSFGSAIA